MELALRSLIILIVLFVVCAALIGSAGSLPHPEFTGSVIGAAGTIFAGWLAWQAVYRQSRIQSAQAAIDLLKIVEQDAETIALEKTALWSLWSRTAQLDEKLANFEETHESGAALQAALSYFQIPLSNSLDILTARVALDPDIRAARMTLNAQFSLLQASIQVFLEDVKQVTGEFTSSLVEAAYKMNTNALNDFISKTRRLLDAANVEEDALRDRARRLRRAANELPD